MVGFVPVPEGSVTAARRKAEGVRPPIRDLYPLHVDGRLLLLVESEDRLGENADGIRRAGK